MLIPILNNDLYIIGTVEFEDNLTISHVADYVNMNCRIGLKKLGDEYGKHGGEIVIMYYDTYNPKASYAEIITKKEAYNECLNRGKLELASKLGLTFMEGEVSVL